MVLSIPEIIELEALGHLDIAHHSILLALDSNLFSPQEEAQLREILARVLSAMPVKVSAISAEKAFKMVEQEKDVAAGLATLEQVNLRLYTQAIQSCFDIGVSYIANAFLLQLCVEQHLTETFTYHHHSGLVCELIPATLTPVFASELFQTGLKTIHAYFAHENPSFLELTTQQFLVDVCLRFPIDTDESEYDTIVLESIKNTFKAMQDESGFDTFIQRLPKKRQIIVN